MTHRDRSIERMAPLSARSRAAALAWLLSSTLAMACTQRAGHETQSADESATPGAAPQTMNDASQGASGAPPTSPDRSDRDLGVQTMDAAQTGAAAADGGTGASTPASSSADPMKTADAAAGPGVIETADAGDAQDAARAVSSLYDDDTKWLCRPGLPHNPCLDTIQVTDVHPDGGTSVSELAKTPNEVPADCLYLYPTVDPGLLTAPRNLDFDQIDKTSVRDIFLGQGVPFREACAIWAPFYRQTSLNSFEQDDTREKGLETAFRDLEAAFDYYLRHSDARRPIVIIAHSQGAIVMTRLLARRFEGHPELLHRLVVAVLAGPLGGFDVPDGKLVGGTLQEIPLCTSEQQTGCALTFSTFAASIPPNENYGRVNGGVKAGFDTGCTTPPGGLDGGAARLSGALFASITGVVGVLAPQFDYGALRIDTQLTRYADFYTARCERSTRGLSFLSVTAEPLPGDVRVDPVLYNSLTLNSPEIGLHALDYAFVSGDLVQTVKTRILAHGK